MAYAQSAVTPNTYTTPDGRTCYHFRFTEAEVGAATTATISGLPTYGTITLVRVAASYTTGATVRPAFGRTVGWTVAGASEINHIGQVSAAAASINDGTNLRYSGLTSGTLYYRSIANAGSDTATTVEITVVEGHI